MCVCWCVSKAIFLTFAKALQCIEPDAAAAAAFGPSLGPRCALSIGLLAANATGCHSVPQTAAACCLSLLGRSCLYPP